MTSLPYKCGVKRSLLSQYIEFAMKLTLLLLLCCKNRELEMFNDITLEEKIGLSRGLNATSCDYINWYNAYVHVNLYNIFVRINIFCFIRESLSLSLSLKVKIIIWKFIFIQIENIWKTFVIDWKSIFLQILQHCVTKSS